MKVLVLYDKFSTYTNAVFDHLTAFSSYSDLPHYYAHGLAGLKGLNIHAFECLVIHYSVRVAWKGISDSDQDLIRDYQGKKVLFVQDEYDNTSTTCEFINHCLIDLVFSCVPQKFINKIYPKDMFPNTIFLNNLTGYVNHENIEAFSTGSIRGIDIGYRGRELPFWYGDLGQEKKDIAEEFVKRSSNKKLSLDISCKDSERIYGEDWPKFLKNCKATLGTESGCNIFDHSGKLKSSVKVYIQKNPKATYAQVKRDVLKNSLEEQIMNQVSPRLFEAVEAGTVLILFEGEYSGIFEPWKHYIPLKKDFSNFEEVVNFVENSRLLDNIAKQAYEDIIASGMYSFKKFIESYDSEITKLGTNKVSSVPTYNALLSDKITKLPEKIPLIKINGFCRRLWLLIPHKLKLKIKPISISTITYMKSIFYKKL
jgi:hypothetical protein